MTDAEMTAWFAHVRAAGGHKKHVKPRPWCWLCTPIEHTHRKLMPMPGCQHCADKLGINIEKTLKALEKT